MEIKNLLKDLKINYNNIEIYKEAFTHMSFVNESKDKTLKSYERLEFLGDSVLNQIVAIYIFNNFKNMEPGEMSLLRSNFVNKEFLSEVSKRLNFESYIRKGKSNLKLSNSIFEDVFESFVGAIYLDVGYNVVRDFIEREICPNIHLIEIDNLKDYKTKLQEFLQAESGKSVIYELRGTKKNDKKELIFIIDAIFENSTLGRGEGKSKKKAEQLAAKRAYEKCINKKINF